VVFTRPNEIGSSENKNDDVKFGFTFIEKYGVRKPRCVIRHVVRPVAYLPGWGSGIRNTKNTLFQY